MSNKAELLKKIKALADRGVDGERESAQTLLARLMEQYGISETDLEEERRETAWFRYSQETERRLLNQIIYMVTGRSGFGCVGSYSGRKRKETGVNCTAADKLAAEIERVNADNRALRRKVERLERELQKVRAGA